MTLLQHEGHACKLTQPMSVLHKHGVAPPAKCSKRQNWKLYFFSPKKEYMTEVVTGLNCTSRAEKFNLRKEYKTATTQPQKLNVTFDTQLPKNYCNDNFNPNPNEKQFHDYCITTYSLNYKKIQVSRGTKKFVPITCTLSSSTLPSATWQQYQKWLTIGSIQSFNSSHPFTLAA